MLCPVPLRCTRNVMLDHKSSTKRLGCWEQLPISISTPEATAVEYLSGAYAPAAMLSKYTSFCVCNAFAVITTASSM